MECETSQFELRNFPVAIDVVPFDSPRWNEVHQLFLDGLIEKLDVLFSLLPTCTSEEYVYKTFNALKDVRINFANGFASFYYYNTPLQIRRRRASVNILGIVIYGKEPDEPRTNCAKVACKGLVSRQDNSKNAIFI